ncbi:TraR/DksA family transcriptional regulator [Streptomyces olivochromogenes]|uniref:TraR/DksA family transcriptional regulator n=1 Tax=Streptomyces olivochromogenes TaxID=1963 RepID=UPI001F289760|nr:TraR/DksA C4-type zinc finger protein [Streptomyces olivochromogenes]MCF3128888.1 TraR/DksA C4-type zinc finger protein [Streptomyces olivochromogenes]
MTAQEADQQAARLALTAQADGLRRELSELDSAISAVREECRPDPADVGPKATSLEQLRLQHDRAGVALSRTLAALDRLDDHSFGLCLDCGRAMGRERMLAVPHAERCVQCEETRSGL